jgi:RNA polymerase sigma-70 factor (ECF subfamily)
MILRRNIMSADDEIKLIKNIVLGNHAAYKDIFLKYFPKVKYFIVHFVKSETIAEDLAQEILAPLTNRNCHDNVRISQNNR